LKHGRPLALSVLAIALLPGCDILDKIPRTPEDFALAASPFGAATRELLEESSEGKVYRVMIESKRAASWTQADFAMWETLQHSCPDGERYVTLSTKPEVVLGSVDSGESSRREWPAGTLFVRTLRCAPKPSYEFEFEASVTQDKGYGQMFRRLSDAAPSSQARQVVRPILDSPAAPKYEQVEQIIGLAVHQMLANCNDGVVVTHPMIGAFPTAIEAKDRGQLAGYVGFILECQGRSPGTAATGS